jgi:hypothetical protein
MGYAARRNPIAQAAAARAPELGELVEHQRIRELAAHIQTEAQLQHILDQVRPSSIRDAVEAQIRPWCAFTRPPLLGADGELIMPSEEIRESIAADLRAVDAVPIQSGNGQPFRINRPYDTSEIVHLVNVDLNVQPADPESFARRAARLDGHDDE